MRTWRLKRGNISLNISPPAREPLLGHREIIVGHSGHASTNQILIFTFLRARISGPARTIGTDCSEVIKPRALPTMPNGEY